MRKKIVTAAVTAVVGAIVVSGIALAGPALAQTVTPTPSPSASPAPSGAPTPGGPDRTARVDRVKEALAGLVTDGTLTQAQADKVAETLSAADPGGGPHGPGRPGGPGGKGGPDLDAAATALGTTADELRTALAGDKTLAQVAAERNVPVDTLVAALVDAEQARIAKDVTEGRITQAQADERLADLQTRVTDRVNGIHPPHPAHAPEDTPAN